jgi:stage III sporulation protein SpoIIIAA
VQTDSNEQRRWQALVETEDKDKRAAMKNGPIQQKGLRETYEDKSFIKMMRGPFSGLDSREGLREDNFYTCAEEDLIEAARTDALRLLVIGKPRAGKTNLSKNLAQRLDLVHINVDNWLKALLAKIKAYEPPEDLEEG